LRKQLNGIAAALGFLTVLPVLASVRASEEGLGRSLKYFPVVGLGIGFFLAYLDMGVGRLFEAPLLTSAVTAVAMIAVSKGLHLDGLADTFDGFLSSKPKERVLEIMKDPRIGAMGAIAVFSVLLLKVTALASLPQEMRWNTILLMPLAGRSALIFEMTVLPYARTDGGLAEVFKRQCGPVHLVWALAVLSAAGWWVLEWTGIIAGLVTFGATLIFSLYCHFKIKGFTGDTLGAACEISELIPALTVLACGGKCLSS
jgi:adenosylcobinamide-GDP ribazoletransferase